jgi:hypothetical protein
METNQNQELNSQAGINPFESDESLAAFIGGQRGESQQFTETQKEPVVETQQAEETSAPVEPQITDELFNKWLEQKTEGKFKQLNEIPVADLSDESRELYELLKEGKTDEVYDYIVKSKVNYKEWDQTDLLVEKIRKENPGLEDSDIEDILLHDYKLYDLTEEEKDNLTSSELARWEADKKRANINAKRDAESMRAELEASRKEIVLPKIEKITPVETKDPNEITPEQVQAAQEAWDQEVDSTLPQVKDLSFDFKIGEEGENYSTTFKLEGDQEQAVKNALKTTYEPGDEKLTFQQLVEKQTFKLYGKQILNAAIKDAVAKAQERFVEKELKRVTLEPGSRRGADSNDKNIYLDMLNQ